jgi:hypothetical protein
MSRPVGGRAIACSQDLSVMVCVSVSSLIVTTCQEAGAPLFFSQRQDLSSKGAACAPLSVS